jgi:hypothetical protein
VSRTKKLTRRGRRGGGNPVCYNYRATLISLSSCLKPVDTFRTEAVTFNAPCGLLAKHHQFVVKVVAQQIGVRARRQQAVSMNRGFTRNRNLPGQPLSAADSYRLLIFFANTGCVAF